jgi:heme exporter protein D
MIDLGPHAVYITWSYLGVTLAIAAMTGWTLLDAQRTRRRLAALEASGIRRRSEGPAA